MSFTNPYFNFFDFDDFNRFADDAFFYPRTQKRLKTDSDNAKNDSQLVPAGANRQVATRPATHLDNWFDNDFALFPFDFAAASQVSVPVDILDHDTNYEVKITVPGVKSKKDINVDYNKKKNQITISGEIPSTITKENEKKVKVKERASGKFKRVITLPDYPGIDTDKIGADYSGGILTLDVPKLKPKKGEKSDVQRIEISSNESWEN